MNTRDDIPKFTDMISMLILEEKNLGLDASSSQGKTKPEQAFYSNSGRGRGRGRGAVKVVAKISLMAHNKIRAMQVEEASLEAGGVKEVEVQDQIGSKMLQIAESVGVVVRRVTCSLTVQK